jgi:hypothetical protein
MVRFFAKEIKGDRFIYIYFLGRPGPGLLFSLSIKKVADPSRLHHGKESVPFSL